MQKEYIIEGLVGNLTLPYSAKTLVIFAHGSGSGRFSPRNHYVAEVLTQHHLGTFLLDLLTAEEEIIDDQTHELRFHIPLLATRLNKVTDFFAREMPHLKIAYFGASTGAAAALVAAATGKTPIQAIVSRGGRPDMAGELLSQIKVPTLLIVGGADESVIELNKQALALLAGPKKLEIIPYATHLFEETGALEQVAFLAARWFEKCSTNC